MIEKVVQNAPIPSASILIVRQGLTGVEIFTVLRNRNLDFAGGVLAYPGGAIEDDDRKIAEKIDPFDDILPYRVAAIRETFEEVGILFAEIDGAPVAQELVDELKSVRHKLARGEQLFSDLVEYHRLAPTWDSLHYMSHWITPEFSPKRFSTRFFAATVPEEQRGIHDGVELVDSFWCTAGKLAEYTETREFIVMPPTWVNADHFVRNRSIGEALAALASIEKIPIQPMFSEMEEDLTRISCRMNGIEYSQLIKKGFR